MHTDDNIYIILTPQLEDMRMEVSRREQELLQMSTKMKEKDPFIENSHFSWDYNKKILALKYSRDRSVF